MPSVPIDKGPSLEKRALGAARLEGARRRRALIKGRVSAFAALVMVVIWAVVLAQTWQPQATSSDPAASRPSIVEPSVSHDASSSATSAPAAPSPAPVVSSQS